MKGLAGIGHVALRITDIDRSLDFYVGKLGLEEMFRLHRDGKLWIVYLRVTDQQFIELFPGGAGTAAPFDTVGYNHLCLECSDIDAALADLAAHGVPLSQARKVGADNNIQAWITDPDGHRIELMQLGANSMQGEALRKLAAARKA